MTFTSMWWRRARSATQLNRDRNNLAWADWQQKNLEISSSWIMVWQKLSIKPLDFWIVMDGAASHLTSYPFKSTSPSEVISKLHEWVDAFQMNPEAICADVAFHHLHDVQPLYRMQSVKRFPTGPHTPWPNRDENGVRLLKKFLSGLVDTASKILDKTTQSQITPAQLMRKAATVRNSQVTLSGKTPMELVMGRRPWNLYELSLHGSRTADIYTNQTGPTQWGNSKVGHENTFRGPTTRSLSTRSCWRNEICSSRFKSRRTNVFLAGRSGQNSERSARTKIWKMVQSWDYGCQGHHGCYQ